MLRRSHDGKTFSDDVRINDQEGNATVGNENPPKVAVSPKGAVYVCWANERSLHRGDIRFARSTDGGKTFSSAMTINTVAAGDPVDCAFQAIAVDPKSRIHVAWIDERNKLKDFLVYGGRGAEIWMAISEDGGKSLSRDRKILSDVCDCRIQMISYPILPTFSYNEFAI